MKTAQIAPPFSSPSAIFSAEFLCLCVQAAEAAERPLPETIRQPLLTIADFIGWLTDTQGQMPAISDDDEGRQCLDNFFTGTRDNIAHLLTDSHFELMRHDVTFPLYVEVDEICNLACPAAPIHYQFDPVQTTKTSVHGAINMLGLAKRVKAKIF